MASAATKSGMPVNITGSKTEKYNKYKAAYKAGKGKAGKGKAK